MLHTPQIRVEHQGRQVAMLAHGRVVGAPYQPCDGQASFELASINGLAYASDRKATTHLVRLQIRGSTHLRGKNGRRDVDHQFAADSLSLMPRGFHLEDVSWSSAHSTALFLGLGNLVAGDEFLFDRMASIVEPRLDLKDPTLNSLMRLLAGELLSECPSGRLFGEGLALAVSTHIARWYGPLSPRKERCEVPSLRFRRVFDFIEANIEADFSLSQLAALVDLSRFHFLRAFRKATGLTPLQYVTHARLNRAKVLLRKGNLTIAEVALSCGFASQSHMTATFSRLTGTSPGQARGGLGTKSR